MNTKNIAIFLVLLIVAVGLFVMFGEDKTQTNSKDFPERSQPEQVMVTDEPVSDISDTVLNGELGEYDVLTFPDNTLDTSDWETYRNEDFGFEMRYPREWETRILNKGDMLGLIDEDNAGIEFTEDLSSVGLRIFFSTEPFSIVRNRKMEWANDGNAFYTLIKVNGVTGIKTTRTKESVLGQTDYSFGNENGTITFNNVREKQELVLEQILLSFQFIY